MIGGDTIKGFALKDGDVVIKNNKIVMVKDDELLRQTVECVVGTNKGEWPLNTNEGIVFQNILGKNKTDDMIKYELQDGLSQVDDTFTITSFELENLGGRRFKVTASAQNADGAELSIDADSPRSVVNADSEKYTE